jgi:competence protein ComFC
MGYPYFNLISTPNIISHCVKIAQMLRRIFEILLSIILPKESKILDIENLDIEYINNLPKAKEIDENTKVLFRYKDKIVKQAVWEIKYRKNQKIIEKFTKVLYDFILEEISDEMLFNNFHSPILIPIPASKGSLKERGFNQCDLIVKELIKIDAGKNFSADFKSLRKIKETKHQSKAKNKIQRLKNLNGCFEADEGIKGKNIILIDDVVTTRATMREAARTLKKAGAKKVIGFAFGH